GRRFMASVEILRPGHIVAFGTRVFHALTELRGFERPRQLQDLKTGRVNLDGTYASVWVLHHPSAYRGLWHHSQRALIRALIRAG
ncbi:MAG: hypothetical protein ACRDTP_08180, partial [Mycobacteriales bacterium]